MKIFISYRRADSEHLVDRIHKKLCESFGRESVFQDIQDIPIATDYRKKLQEAIRQCNVLVVLIGPNWLNAVDAHGRRRLDLPDDWVRLEIEMACTRKIHIVPVLFDNARCPEASLLPESISSLAFQQCHRLRSESSIDEGLDQMVLGISDLGPLPGNADAMLTFELKSDQNWKLDCDNIWEAHNVNCAILSVVSEHPLRVICWEGEPYRVTFESTSAGFRSVLDQYLNGKLDKVTKLHWVSCEPVPNHDMRTLALQTPFFYSSDKKRSGKRNLSLICHAVIINGFENEWLEAQEFVGLPTRDPKEVRAYISRGYNGDLYVHSNFIKQGAEYPTKIQTNENLDLLTIFLNLTVASDSQFQLRLSIEEGHQYYAHYFVNERRIPKGNVPFYNGATHVHFVQPEPKIPQWEIRLHRYLSLLSSWPSIIGANAFIASVVILFKTAWLAKYLLVSYVSIVIAVILMHFVLDKRYKNRMSDAYKEINRKRFWSKLFNTSELG